MSWWERYTDPESRDFWEPTEEQKAHSACVAMMEAKGWTPLEAKLSCDIQAAKAPVKTTPTDDAANQAACVVQMTEAGHSKSYAEFFCESIPHGASDGNIYPDGSGPSEKEYLDFVDEEAEKVLPGYKEAKEAAKEMAEGAKDTALAVTLVLFVVGAVVVYKFVSD